MQVTEFFLPKYYLAVSFFKANTILFVLTCYFAVDAFLAGTPMDTYGMNSSFDMGRVIKTIIFISI